MRHESATYLGQQMLQEFPSITCLEIVVSNAAFSPSLLIYDRRSWCQHNQKISDNGRTGIGREKRVEANSACAGTVACRQHLDCVNRFPHEPYIDFLGILKIWTTGRSWDYTSGQLQKDENVKVMASCCHQPIEHCTAGRQ